MIEVWPTVVCPVLDALRPQIIVDASPDGRLASRVSERAAEWGGRVVRLRQETASDLSADGDALIEVDELQVLDVDEPADLLRRGTPQMALLHGDANWWTVSTQLKALAEAQKLAGGPFPLTLVHNTSPVWGRRDRYSDPKLIPAHCRQPHTEGPYGPVALDEGTPHNGVEAAVSEFAQSSERIETIFLPGLGGTALIFEEATLRSAPEALRGLITELRLSPAMHAHLAVLEEDRRSALANAASAQPPSRTVEDASAADDEIEALRLSLREMGELLSRERLRVYQARAESHPQATEESKVAQAQPQSHPSPASHDRPDADRNGVESQTDTDREPTSGLVREILRPSELLGTLGWSGSESELSLPIPNDARGIVGPASTRQVVIEAGEDEIALRRTLCSLLERATSPISPVVLLPDGVPNGIVQLARRAAIAVGGLRILTEKDKATDALVLAAGEQLPWGWPRASANRGDLRIAYVLPGLPAEGSGGSHSVIQEARGLRDLGATVHVCVPLQAMQLAGSLYGSEDQLFAGYAPDTLADAVGEASVVVATEHTSVQSVAVLARERPEIVCAYYVQDYETLFAPPGSPRSDRALLSYRALPGHLLFAKTDWIANIVRARHRVPVAKVLPSLDRQLFHAEGRVQAPRGVIRVLAMVRPRTPRRRPRATVRTLAAISQRLGDGAQIHTFGCTREELTEVCGGLPAPGTHHGTLSRSEVAGLMRSADVFIDASAYQAFGRTGLEAMACGAVAVLPAVGGVHEYAIDAHNALIAHADDPDSIAEMVISLARDPERLGKLCQEGLRTVLGYSIELAARSQLELFTAAVAARQRT